MDREELNCVFTEEGIRPRMSSKMLSMFSASEMLISFIINSAEKTGQETRPDPGRKKSNRECGINCIHISLFCINAER